MAHDLLCVCVSWVDFELIEKRYIYLTRGIKLESGRRIIMDGVFGSRRMAIVKLLTQVFSTIK